MAGHVPMMIHGGRFGRVRESLLTSMFALRHREFGERLGWAVNDVDGLERDGFDDLDPVYLIEERDGAVVGSVRLLRTTGPYMLRDVFSELVRPSDIPVSEKVWECSRFVIDGDALGIGMGQAVKSRLQIACYELALFLGLEALVAVYSPRMHSALTHAGFEIHPLGRVKRIGKDVAMAGTFPITPEGLDVVRAKTQVDAPVLSLRPNMTSMSGHLE